MEGSYTMAQRCRSPDIWIVNSYDPSLASCAMSPARNVCVRAGRARKESTRMCRLRQEWVEARPARRQVIHGIPFPITRPLQFKLSASSSDVLDPRTSLSDAASVV